ncbi:MAG: DUF2313 domain-containing protein [Clostridia bacterium]|nr:DUF2313 domain-containing protein [Clostridia bacterium]
MQKTITLSPSWITDGSAFSGVLGGGSDYRTMNAGASVDVGTIGFDCSPLRGKSAACILNGVSVSYRQKCNYDQVGGESSWALTPVKLTDYSVSGTALTVRSQVLPFGRVYTSYTDGNDWLDKGGAFIDGANSSTVDGSDVFTGSALLGFFLHGHNGGSFRYQLHMDRLSVTVAYTPRYYADFYDPDTNERIERQTVNGGEAPVPPVIQKDGYRVVGWASRGMTYETLPAGTDTNVSYYPVFEPVTFCVTVPRTENAACRVTADGAQMTLQELNETESCCFVRYGAAVRIHAVSFNDRSEDLRVTVNGTQFIVDGSDGSDLLIYETDSLTEDVAITVQAVPVFCTVETTAGVGGSVTARRTVRRHASVTAMITPDTGYEIASVLVNGDTVSVTPGGMLLALDDVTEDKSITAAFSKIRIPITLIHSQHVTVEGPRTVDFGDDAAWTVRASAGYSISTVKLNSETVLDTFAATQTHEIALFSIESPVSIEVTESGELVTVAFSAAQNGRILGEEGTFIKGKGTLTFDAVPDTGYIFSGWTGADWPSSHVVLDTANAGDSYTLGASFTLLAYRIIAASQQGGSAIASLAAANYGDEVTLTAIPDEGWSFKRWAAYVTNIPDAWEYPEGEIYAYSENPVWVLTVVGDVDATAEFHQEDYTLQTPVESPDGAGVGGTVTRDSASESFHFADEIALETVPAEGYRFVRWSDGVYSARRTFSMPSHDVMLTALFRRYEYSTDVLPAEHASILLETNGNHTEQSASVKYGDSLTVQIVCDYGWRVQDVLLDDSSIGQEITRTARGAHFVLSAVTAKHVITVLTEAKTYTNGRKLLDYWPPVIAKIQDMQQIAKAQQPLIDEAWDAASWLMENQFIDTATEEAVSVWEQELGIIPVPTDTLAQRKKRLRMKWVPDNRFTMRWLYRWLKDTFETDKIKKPTVADYILSVSVPASPRALDVFRELEAYKPANIALSAGVSLGADAHALTAGIGLRVSVTIKIESEDKESEDNQ